MSMELERPLCIAEGQLYYSEPPGAALIVSFPLLLKDFHKKSMGDSVIGSDKICISSDPYEWTRIQESLKKEVIVEDDFAWIVAEREGKTSTCFGNNQLHYIGGVDLSFSKDDPSVACGALVVVDFNTMNVVYEDYNVSRLQNPYVPGFLAFREGPIIVDLLEKMRSEKNPFYPQLLMVDGNGLLHPRGFGLACHLGVLADIPTIGIGKNLHHVDGLTESGVRQVLRSQNQSSDEVIMLTGNSGKIWGAAIRATASSLKPIYVSIGHRISLETAVRIVKNCCIYRVPEPTRQVNQLESDIGRSGIHCELDLESHR